VTSQNQVDYPLLELYKFLIQPMEKVFSSIPDKAGIRVCVDGLLVKVGDVDWESCCIIVDTRTFVDVCS